MKEILIEPLSLKISGPVELLKSVSRLETAPVNLALFNKDEGSTTVSLSDIDHRLKFEEIPKVKLKYKTLYLKRNIKNNL
jgi:hypothetical protein